MHTYCEICGKRINYGGKGRPPKYCKDCFIRQRKQYLKRYHTINREIYHKILGTTDIKPYICRDEDGKPDWDKEYAVIQKEIKRIGLKIPKKYKE